MGFTADEKHENADFMKSTPTPQTVIRMHTDITLIFHYNILCFSSNKLVM